MLPFFKFSGKLVKFLGYVICKRVDCLHHYVRALVMVRMLLVVLRERHIKTFFKFLFVFVVLFARFNQLLKKKPLRCEFIGVVT